MADDKGGGRVSDFMDVLMILAVLVPAIVLLWREIKIWDDRGLGAVEIIIIVLIMAAITAFCAQVTHAEERYHLTCYCPESCPGTITYTGTTVREGVAAVHPDHIGDVAVVYTTSGNYIGRFICEDKLGTGRRGVIDIWKPDLASAKDLMALTEGRCLVKFFSQEK